MSAWVLAVAAGLALADASVVTLALPQLLTELHTSVEGVAAVIGVYTFVLAGALLPAASLRERSGSARVGAIALVVFAAACAGCASVHSLAALLLFRAVQAVGGAGALVAAFDLIDAGGDPRRRRLWTAAAVVGFATGPALGGALTQAFDWRAIFVAQAPVALVGALAALTGGGTRRALPAAGPAEDLGAAPPADALGPAPPPARSLRAWLIGRRGPLVALALLSAALTAVLFLLVLLLVSGWNLTPLEGAATVSALPLAALAGGRIRGDVRARASIGCLLVGAGTLCLAYVPLASAWWTVPPQLLAGVGMGLALPALAGELLPERDATEASRLLTARHAGIAVALLILAPVISSNIASSTERARERGVALVLDSALPPSKKIDLAPALLRGVRSQQPRAGLKAAIAQNRRRFSGSELTAYDSLARRADDTLIDSLAESFRLAFLIAGAFALIGALAVLPGAGRRRALAGWAVAAALAPVAYVGLHAGLAPEPVKLADPCKPRQLPLGAGGGIETVMQDAALLALDRAACNFGSTREELVLALADNEDRKRFERRHGADPTSLFGMLKGLLGR